MMLPPASFQEAEDEKRWIRLRQIADDEILGKVYVPQRPDGTFICKHGTAKRYICDTCQQEEGRGIYDVSGMD